MNSAPNQPVGFRTLIRHVTPYKLTMIFIILLMLGASAISLASPWLAGKVAASLLGNTEMASMPLNSLLLLWLLLLAIQGVLSFSNRYLVGSVGEQMLTRLRIRIYDHLQSLPLGYFQERKRGETLALVVNDAAILSNFVTGTLLGLLPQLVTLLGALFFVALIDPLIALVVAIVVPFFYLLMKVVGRRIRPLSRAIIDEYASTFSIVEENLNLLPVIKAFTRETVESGRVAQGNQRLLQLTKEYLRVQSVISPLIQFLAAAGILLLVGIAAMRLQSGDMTPPELVSLLLYGMLLTRPVSGLADVYGQIQYARGATERLIHLFSMEPEPMDSGKQSLPAHMQKIEFCDLRFVYPGRDEVLSGLDLRIEAGETIAITGENGAGKSTLAHILMRFIEPNSGRVLIDGKDIRSVTLSSLRSQIGLVQQHVLLLNGSVRENIAFGVPDASDEQIDVATRAAHALTFIQKLPDGFDTVIGDQGVRLSGGQKQRLALARALLKMPPILILDEATAMFDPAGEESFIQEAQAILDHCTVILITHRPASLALADKVFEIRDGQAVQIS